MTPEEINNLSQLLLSTDEKNIRLGFEILEHNQEHIPDLSKELLIVCQLNVDKPINNSAYHLLSKKYEKKVVQKMYLPFRIFNDIRSHYTYNTSTKTLIENHEKARPIYQDLILKNPDYALEYGSVATSLHKNLNKHHDLVETYFGLALQSNPNHVPTLFNYAYFLDKDELNFDKALEVYLKVLSIQPQDAPTLNNIGRIYQLKRAYSKALRYYDAAVKIDPYEFLFLRNKGGCALAIGTNEYNQMAKKIFKQLTEDEEWNGSNWNYWADYLWNVEHKYEEAEKAYLDGLKQDPDNDLLLGNLGELYIDIYKNIDKGLTYYKKALEVIQTVYRLTTMITVLVNDVGDLVEGKKYYIDLQQLCLPRPIYRDLDLKDNQWEAFLEAEKKILNSK